MIATQDIAAAAAERLAKLDFSGKSARELLGQLDLTMTESAYRGGVGHDHGRDEARRMSVQASPGRPAGSP